MAKIHFRKEGSPSIKTNLPSGIYRRRWKIGFIISGVINVLSIGFLIYKHFNN